MKNKSFKKIFGCILLSSIFISGCSESPISAEYQVHNIKIVDIKDNNGPDFYYIVNNKILVSAHSRHCKPKEDILKGSTLNTVIKVSTYKDSTIKYTIPSSSDLFCK